MSRNTKYSSAYYTNHRDGKDTNGCARTDCWRIMLRIEKLDHWDMVHKEVKHRDVKNRDVKNRDMGHKDCGKQVK